MIITKKNIGGIAAVALLGAGASLFGQQAPSSILNYLQEDFDSISADWVVDRNEPTAFESVDGKLKITVGEATSAESRPSGRSGQFYDTQGYKRLISDGGVSPVHVGAHDGSLVITATLELPEVLDDYPMRTDLWARFVATSDNTSESNVGAYPIIGFTNFDGVDQPLRPRLQLWDYLDPEGAWIEIPVSADGTVQFTVVVTENAARHYVNGKMVLALPNDSGHWLTHVMLQAYNFTSDRFDPVGNPGWSNEEYSVTWDDLQVYVTQDDIAHVDVYPGDSIQAAIDAAVPGDVIHVNPGAYVENININKNISLIGGSDGNGLLSDEVIITPADSAQNTIHIAAGSDGVSIEGLTIYGVDGASPAIEKSAIYVQGAQSNLRIADNTIIAAGDAALTTEYNAVIDGLEIIGNTFEGKTFVGENPATGNQFEVANVARQLIAIQSLANGSGIRFEGNTVSGAAAGPNGNGNTLVSIDAENAEIVNNTFNGVASGALLRARSADTVISNNTFDPSNLVGAGYILLVSTEALGDNGLGDILDDNAFINGYAVANQAFSGVGSGATGGYYVDASISAAVARASSEVVVLVHGTHVENVNVPADKTIYLVGDDATLTGAGGANTAALFIRSSNSSVSGFTINKADTGYAAILIGNGTTGVGIYDNTIVFAGPGIESQGANTTDLDIVGNTFVASLNASNFARGVYINGGYKGPGNLTGPAAGLNISGNTFQGSYGLGGVIGVEGTGQISANDFTGVEDASVFIGVQVGPLVVDGNCFPATEELILSGSAGEIVAEFNYFGRSNGALASNYEGNVDVNPHLLSCDEYFLVEAEQSTGGVISPAFAYTNSSAAPTFTFTPNAGFEFSAAYLNDAPITVQGGSYTVSGVTDHSTISAVFTATASMITSSIGEGSGTVLPLGTVTVASGGSKSFTIIPAAGYQVGQVLYNGTDMKSSMSGNTLTIGGVIGANNLEVIFEQAVANYQVSISKTGMFTNYLTVTAFDDLNDTEITDLTSVPAGTKIRLEFSFSSMQTLLKVKSVSIAQNASTVNSGALSIADGGSYTITAPVNGAAAITVNVGL